MASLGTSMASLGTSMASLGTKPGLGQGSLVEPGIWSNPGSGRVLDLVESWIWSSPGSGPEAGRILDLGLGFWNMELLI